MFQPFFSLVILMQMQTYNQAHEVCLYNKYIACLLTKCVNLIYLLVLTKHSQWTDGKWIQLISSAAVLVFTFPSEIPATGSCKRLKGTIINICICATIAICVACLTAVITFGYANDSLSLYLISHICLLSVNYNTNDFIFIIFFSCCVFSVHQIDSLPYQFYRCWRNWIFIISNRPSHVYTF